MEPLSRNELRVLRGLTSRPVRRRRGVFLLEGIRALRTALEVDADVRLIAVTDDVLNHPVFPDVQALAEERNIPIKLAAPEIVMELSDTTTSPGILASVAWQPVREAQPQMICEIVLASGARRLLCLDAVSDPGNVGSLLRAADAFGMDGVLLGTGSVESTNPKVVRSAVGSLFNLPIVAEEVSLAPVLQQLQEQSWQVLRAEARGGMALPSVIPEAKWVLLLGSEAHGVSDELGATGEAVHIEMRGAAGSLNVAMAGGILLHGLTEDRKPAV